MRLLRISGKAGAVPSGTPEPEVLCRARCRRVERQFAVHRRHEDVGRARAAERALEGRSLDAATIAAAASAATEGTSPSDNALGSAWYRREIVGVHLRRLLSGQE